MPPARNTIRTFALCCVAATSLFAMGIIVWLTVILSGRDWCDRAIGAAKTADGMRPEYAVGGCFSLLQRQVEALAWNSHIFALVLGLCLMVLVVIVIAGGRLSFKGGKDGIEADISSGAAEGAQQAANAAQDVADTIAGGAA